MSASSPVAFYETRLTLHTDAHAGLTRRIRLLSQARLLVVLAALVAGYFAIRDGGAQAWGLTAALFALFLVLVRIHQGMHEAERLLQIRLGLIRGEQAAMTGDSSRFSDGSAYLDPVHPFSYDLDIFGKGSVYQLLCRTVTHNGSDSLAGLLMHPRPDRADIVQRQEIIRELAAAPVLQEDFRTAGLSVEEEPGDYGLLTGWLSGADDFRNNMLAKVAIVVMPLIVVSLLVLSLLTGAIHPLLGLAFPLNWIILGIFTKKIKRANAQVGRASRLVEKYSRLQGVAAAASFTHPWLRDSSAQCAAALVQVARFRKLAHLFDSRNNGMVGPLVNSLFLFDIYCMLRLERWRHAHREQLLQTLATVIELDVYVGSAVYAFNNPDHVYPEISEAGTAIEAADLRHPLLRGKAVGNHFSLGKNEQFYLLTGANMTGKSTFIRTVGISVVMGYAGLPLPATAVLLPLLRLYTSIRVTDSVQDDVSYFRAELNRIKAIMTAAGDAGAPYLILLDEPLRGTNSADKQMGTRSIIESLLQHRAIGIVATHDIGLCSLEEEHSGRVHNYHFESAVAAEGLTFDFKLRPGGSTSNNATVLMRQMGIIG